MKHLLLASLLMAVAATASAQTYVEGYYRKDGTYVPGHYRSNPDSQRLNNYNAQNGMGNPWTGQQGTQRDELSNPPAYNQPRKQCYRDGWGNKVCY